MSASLVVVGLFIIFALCGVGFELSRIARALEKERTK